MKVFIENEEILIDKEDQSVLQLHKWRLLKTGDYKRVVAYYNKKFLYLHRVILNISDPNILVDHINMNPLDNRKSNLRLSDKSSNGMNRPKNKNNRSGYKGVSYDPRQNRYAAELMVKGIRYRKSGFKTAKEAATYYNELAKKHHGEFAKLNELSP